MNHQINRFYKSNQIQPLIPQKSKSKSLSWVYSKLCTFRLINQITEYHQHTILNPMYDTDFMIAALQNIWFPGRKKQVPFFSFQPVYRDYSETMIPANEQLPVFVNVGLLKESSTLEDYYFLLEMLFDFLSFCSIHISRVSLSMKNQLRTGEGIGLKIWVDDHELGQANYYFRIGGKSDVTDIGFGLERLCYAVDYFHDFPQVYMRTSDKLLYSSGIIKKISAIVAFGLSGIRPGGQQKGQRLRKLFREVFGQGDGIPWDYPDILRFYYDYWAQFIQPKITCDQLIEMFITEMRFRQQTFCRIKLGQIENE